MPGPAAGGGQISDAPVPICSPTLGGCWVQVSSWLPPAGSTPCPASASPCPPGKLRHRVALGCLALILPAAASAHLWLCGDSRSSIPAWHRALRSMVASVPPLLAWMSIAPSDCPGLWQHSCCLQACQDPTTAATCSPIAVHRKRDKNILAGEAGAGLGPGLEQTVLSVGCERGRECGQSRGDAPVSPNQQHSGQQLSRAFCAAVRCKALGAKKSPPDSWISLTTR